MDIVNLHAPTDNENERRGTCIYGREGREKQGMSRKTLSQILAISRKWIRRKWNSMLLWLWLKAAFEHIFSESKMFCNPVFVSTLIPIAIQFSQASELCSIWLCLKTKYGETDHNDVHIQLALKCFGNWKNLCSCTKKHVFSFSMLTKSFYSRI